MRRLAGDRFVRTARTGFYSQRQLDASVVERNAEWELQAEPSGRQGIGDR